MKPFAILTLLFIATTAQADPPDVVGVTATQSGEGWRFDVTIARPDTGWDGNPPQKPRGCGRRNFYDQVDSLSQFLNWFKNPPFEWYVSGGD